VLTYNGDQRWTPEHDADAAMAQAFRAHQRRDKGFGAAAGPDAAQLLRETFLAASYSVTEADSAWRLGAGDRKLMNELAHGFARAVAETGLVAPAAVAGWSGIARSGAIVGHTDMLALPPD
jgi:hypothetical protein